MYENMDGKYISDVNCIVNDLKNLTGNIENRFSNFQFKDENVSDNFLSTSNDKELYEELNNIKKLTDEICDKLEGLNSFTKEFHAFLSIQNMVGYIVEDLGRFILHSSFILELISSFYRLISIKRNIMKKDDLDNYEKSYKEFEDYLSEKEEYFYLNIYKCTHQYDDLIVQVTNILW